MQGDNAVIQSVKENKKPENKMQHMQKYNQVSGINGQHSAVSI